MMNEWSGWHRFPDPRRRELLTAPLGPGCYELRDGTQLVLYGMSSHVAVRMTSLLPAPLGCGTRNNKDKRRYVLDHLGSIQYRTVACATREEAKRCERELQANRMGYKFHT
jgi:hypothetical protein